MTSIIVIIYDYPLGRVPVLSNIRTQYLCVNSSYGIAAAVLFDVFTYTIYSIVITVLPVYIFLSLSR